MSLPVESARRRRARRQAGYTLLEAIIALALVAIAMLLAADLLDESRRLLDAAGRDAVDPMPRYAVVTLQRDLAAARAVTDPLLPGLWVTGPLDIVSAEPGQVRYQVEGRSLVRLGFDAAGVLTHRRVALQGLDRWRWRHAGVGLIDVELRYRRSSLSILGSTPRESARRRAPRPVVDRFRVALRGSRPANRW